MPQLLVVAAVGYVDRIVANHSRRSTLTPVFDEVLSGANLVIQAGSAEMCAHWKP